MFPQLSIVIPAYNVEDYIVPAIQSALEQSLEELEVIVVDDGSTDLTPERIASVQDSRLKIITQENAGLSAARNAGIRESRGKYIGLLDGDDIWTPRKAEIHLSLMEQDPTIGITYSYLAYIDTQGKTTGQYLISKVKQPNLKDMIVRNHIIPSSAIIRKDCFLQAGLFDENLRSIEDYDIWVRILNLTKYKIRLIPKPLAKYRVRGDSLSENFDLFLRNAHMVIEKFQATIPQFTVDLKNRALAEIYRTISRKALSSGNLELAREFMKEVLGYCPTIIFRDLRAFGTFFLICTQSILPLKYHEKTYRLVRCTMKLFYRYFIKQRADCQRFEI